MVEVSVIIPAYNEEGTIASAIAATEGELKRLKLDYEIIVAEDGSSDRTAEVVRAMKNPRVRLLHSDRRLGKGAALSAAMTESVGDIVAFIDSDLSSDIALLGRLIEGVQKKAPISVGSRLMGGVEVCGAGRRNLARLVYNSLVRLILGSGVRDHQCGFKAFRKMEILPFVQRTRSKGWFWDTELLVLAQRGGLKVDEFPVRWKQGKTSRVSLFRDSAKMLVEIIKMRFFS